MKLNVSGIELDQVRYVNIIRLTSQFTTIILSLILQIMESITTTAFPNSSASIFEVKLFSENVSRLVRKRS